MKKKMMAAILSTVIVTGLTGCGNETGGTGETADTPNTSNTESESEESSDNETAEISESGKTLVVYYSATGHTENVANVIAESTSADILELEPVDDYTDEDLDWTESGSRVNAEHDDPELRNIELVADTVENWESYDTVYIGYPIWWGIAAWPVDTFVKSNDFTGKTVIPFATAASSGLGQSGELLQEMAGTGNWLEGERFSSNVNAEDVVEWVEAQ